MPDERLITEIENILSQVVELGAEKERTRLGPNLLVTNAAPTGLANYILVKDDRDGDNILALKVPGVIYNTNDLVNVLFVRGGEAIAFQQGSGSDSSGIWGIVAGTSTDIFYNDGDVGIGKSVAPDARLEVLDASQAQLRLTHTEDVDYADFQVDTNANLAITPSGTGQIQLVADVTITEDIVHAGDADTLITFTDDRISFDAGGLNLLRLTETAQDLVEIGDVGGAGDVDINFNNGQAFLRGSDGRLGVGTTSPQTSLQVGSGTPFIVSGANNIIMAGPDTTSGRFYIEGTGQADLVFVDSGAALDRKACQLINNGGFTAFRSLTDAAGVNVANIINLEHNTGNVGLSVAAPSTRLDVSDGAIEFEEMTAPSAGAANTARLFAQDNGSGKTQLAVRFNTGAIQILATEP